MHKYKKFTPCIPYNKRKLYKTFDVKYHKLLDALTQYISIRIDNRITTAGQYRSEYSINNYKPYICINPSRGNSQSQLINALCHEFGHFLCMLSSGINLNNPSEVKNLYRISRLTHNKYNEEKKAWRYANVILKAYNYDQNFWFQYKCLSSYYK